MASSMVRVSMSGTKTQNLIIMKVNSRTTMPTVKVRRGSKAELITKVNLKMTSMMDKVLSFIMMERNTQAALLRASFMVRVFISGLMETFTMENLTLETLVVMESSSFPLAKDMKVNGKRTSTTDKESYRLRMVL